MSANYIKTAKDIISNMTGLEVDEIHDESYFEDDLNIGHIELHEILTEIEEKLDVDLSVDEGGLETFGDLATALNEKLE